jgi:hypothetical protein
MLGKIRSWIGRYYFKKDLAKSIRNRTLINLRDARKIGILYSLDDVTDYDVVSEFVTRLQHDHKEVKALGFVKNKNLVSRFLPKLSYDFFSAKDVNLFYKPVDSKVRDFINREFDVLIDLSMKETLPLLYIAGCSMAQCRVGKFSEDNTACYDLMIDVGPTTLIKDFIDQIIHYLTIINSDTKITE